MARLLIEKDADPNKEFDLKTFLADKTGEENERVNKESAEIEERRR